MKYKRITLVGKTLETFRWDLIQIINEKGKIISIGNFVFQDSQEKRANTERWRLLNSEKHVVHVKTWRKKYPNKARINDNKHKAKRRCLGFIPLNDSFNESVGHHIDKEFVLYIPKELHKIKHNVFTGEGMDRINEIALNYCYGKEL